MLTNVETGKSQAFFTIIIPVYNEKKYLRECVLSLAETVTPLEIILIDDGSTDGSSALCDVLCAADKRMSVVHQENRGLSAARNAGIAAASGMYTVFLDSDDYLAPNGLDRLAHCLRTCSGVDVLITRVTELFSNGTISDRDPHMERFISELSAEVTKDDAVNWVFCQSDCASIAPRFIVRTALLKEKCICFEMGRLHEDIAWTVELIANAKTFCFCAERWYYYRRSVTGSISGNMRLKNVEDVIYFTKKYLPLEGSDDLSVKQKESIRASLSSGCCYSLSKLAGMSRENKLAAARALGSAQPLSYSKKLKHRAFVCFMRLIGCKNAVLCLTAILEWKMKVRPIAKHA